MKLRNKKQWNELAIILHKLNKIKSKIVIDYFWHVRHKCRYYQWDSTLHVMKKTHHCDHPKHFETSTGKTFCVMDECPILMELVDKLQDEDWKKDEN